MINRLRRSLGARILILAGVNVALLIVIGLFASGVRLPRNVDQVITQSAEPRLQDVARRIALDLERIPENGADALLDRYGTEFRTRFMLVRNDGTRVAGVSLPIPREMQMALAGPRPQEGPGPRDGFRPPPREDFPPRGGRGPDQDGPGPRMPQTPAQLVRTVAEPHLWILIRTPIRFAGTDIVPGSLMIVPYGMLGDPLLFPLKGLWWLLLAVGVTTACWWPMLHGITKSLRRMEHATEEISHGRFETKVAVERVDELGRLSTSIETMAGRLGTMVSGQTRFLGDTAHELRSPLGRMQVALEILDTRVQDTERPYVIDLKEDVEALSQLTDELLLYARAELADRSRTLKPVALKPIVDRVIAKEGNNAAFSLKVDANATVIGEDMLIERAIANVVRNAVKYAAAAGSIEVSTMIDGDTVVLSIADSGPGVAPESLARLFDPFFREDAARNRRTGGVGLGLAIVRSAIESCGGGVTCRNRQPHGLDVRLSLPAIKATVAAGDLR